jgi:methyl-accepting chemotaxis protein
MRISVGTKLICTYLAVIALTVAPAAGICYYLKHVRQSQAQALNVAQPTVAAAKGVREGLYESAAGLRGYLAIGGEHFRAQREQGQERARKNLQELDRLTPNAAAKERQLLDQIRRELGDIEAIHRAMETAPQQAHEMPAFQKLAGDSTPLGERMLAACNAMIEAESKLEKTPQRAKLLDEMTGLRAALHGSLMEMHSYLTTAQEQHVKNFADQWQNLGAGLTALAAKRRMLTPEQNRQFGQVQQFVGQFQPLPDRLFAMRKSQSWTIAQQKVKDEAGPREAQAEALLAQLIQRTEARAQQAQQTLQTQSAWLGMMAVGGPGAAAILGILVGFAATRRISRRVQQTTRALEAVAAGDLTARLPAETRDEFGRMALAINSLAEAAAERSRSTAPQPQIQPELNTERLRAFVHAEIGRRRPFARPQAAAARQSESFAQETDASEANIQQTVRSFQATLGQIAANAGRLANDSRRVTAGSQQINAGGTAGPAAEAISQPSAEHSAAAPADAQFRSETAQTTDSMAASSERLRTQATQLDQLMRQLQEGLARIAAADPEATEAADETHSDMHGAESALGGPKALAGRQSVLQST